MIRYFASHPTAANLVMAGLMILGLVVAPYVKRETFPDIPADMVEVRVPYPGATAEEVENAICQRIEEAVDGVEALRETRCEASEGLAIAVIRMREDASIDRFLDDVKTEVEAIDTFPDNAETPVTRQLGLTDFIATVAISGPMAPPDLKAYGEMVKDSLLRIPGVSKVTLGGFSEHQIRIEVPATTLRQYGLDVAAIADAVARQSIDLPTGAIETRDDTLLVRFADERRSPRAFQDLVVVATAGGAQIRLGDIATITDRFELDEAKTLFNGERAAYLVVEKSKDDDTLDVIDGVKAFIESHRATAPPGMTLAVTQDITSIVRDRLTMLLRNGAQGLTLVFLTMWLFFSLRHSFWVALGLPVSFLGTIAVMSAIGYSFDMITMVGLLIAVGLIMDDAIVISENIATHWQRGKTPIEAAVDGVREVAPGVISSFLTTACIFGSLAFLTGHIGSILKVMPVIVLATLAVSLVEAFLILPHHLRRSVAKGRDGPGAGFRRRIEGGLEWTREAVVGRVADWAVRRRYLTAGLVIGLLLLSVSAIAGGLLKFRAFPDLDGDVIEARILLPQGTPLKRTESVVGRVTHALDLLNAEFAPRQPGGRSLVRNVGIQYNKNVDAFETGAHVATVSVDLLKAEDRDATLDEVLGRWRVLTGPLADVIAVKFTERQLGPGGRAIEIRLQGHDLGKLKAASQELLAWLDAYRGVHDLSDDFRPGKPELRLRLRDGASALGLNAAAIATQLRSAFQGKTVGEIQVGPESYEIDIRLPPGDRDSIADLEYFTVTAPGGEQVPLGTVAVIEDGRGWARINRVDGQRTITVHGDVDTQVANTGEIIEDTRRRFLPGLAERHPGLVVSFEGQAAESQDTGSSLRRNFAIGLIGVFLLLSFQFRGYVEPVVVMIAIPLGLIGAVVGHLLLGLDLSMPSMVGMASLAGIVVNNSILLVLFIRRRRRAGETVAEAAAGAVRQRFRAIALTTLTTVAGMLPLLTEQSLQAQVLIPLVTSLVFGLISATLLVLLAVPALYVILDDFGLTTKLEEELQPAPMAL
ncbi:MAG: efflux RND transporter permease subunit [Rhodospirillales bacterium]|nr:efflux RND transporter permease subunit [Rhodospirillales bacterium]